MKSAANGPSPEEEAEIEKQKVSDHWYTLTWSFISNFNEVHLTPTIQTLLFMVYQILISVIIVEIVSLMYKSKVLLWSAVNPFFSDSKEPWLRVVGIFAEAGIGVNNIPVTNIHICIWQWAWLVT